MTKVTVLDGGDFLTAFNTVVSAGGGTVEAIGTFNVASKFAPPSNVRIVGNPTIVYTGPSTDYFCTLADVDQVTLEATLDAGGKAYGTLLLYGAMNCPLNVWLKGATGPGYTVEGSADRDSAWNHGYVTITNCHDGAIFDGNGQYNACHNKQVINFQLPIDENGVGIHLADCDNNTLIQPMTSGLCAIGILTEDPSRDNYLYHVQAGGKVSCQVNNTKNNPNIAYGWSRENGEQLPVGNTQFIVIR